MILEYAAAMMMTVKAVSSARKTARYWWSPRFLNASSGPYEEDESPSAPRPTQARNAASDSVWKSCGSWKSLGPPRRTRLNFCHVVGGSCGCSGGGGTLLGAGGGARSGIWAPLHIGDVPLFLRGRREKAGQLSCLRGARPAALRLPHQSRQRPREEAAIVDGVRHLVALDARGPRDACEENSLLVQRLDVIG